MKKTGIIYTVLLAGVLGSAWACNDTKKETPPEEAYKFYENQKKYELVWQAEFNDEPTVDGKAILPGNEWWFEVQDKGWVNNELQRYVDRVAGTDTVAKIENGNLVITAFKVDRPGQEPEIISARMNTAKSWKYGKFEMRAKLPGGKGTWPAFWMLPENFQSWPMDGEIDIMEYVGYDSINIHASIHTQAYYHSIGTQKTAIKKTIEPTPTEGYHTYSVSWEEDYIAGFVDDEVYFIFLNDKKGNKETWPFDEPFYLKLNLAIGGDWGGAEGVDDDIFPAKYYIDYVRVYQIPASK